MQSPREGDNGGGVTAMSPLALVVHL
jgi:hypothetical protein